MKDLIIAAKSKFKFEGVITGALYSEYQSSRIKKICDELGLKCINPLWHKDQQEYMQELIDNKFEIIFTAIAADGLNKTWLNKVIRQEELEELKQLHKKIGFHQAGEGGEFESLVVNCPLFKKKLVIEEFEIKEENEYTARMVVKKVKLE